MGLRTSSCLSGGDFGAPGCAETGARRKVSHVNPSDIVNHVHLKCMVAFFWVRARLCVLFSTPHKTQTFIERTCNTTLLSQTCTSWPILFCARRVHVKYLNTCARARVFAFMCTEMDSDPFLQEAESGRCPGKEQATRMTRT